MLEFLRIKENNPNGNDILKVKECMKTLNPNLRGVIQYKINLIKKLEL
jgi:hypothetical protein